MANFELSVLTERRFTLKQKEDEANLSGCLTENSSPEVRLNERKIYLKSESREVTEIASPDLSLYHVSNLAWESESTEVEKLDY